MQTPRRGRGKRKRNKYFPENYAMSVPPTLTDATGNQTNVKNEEESVCPFPPASDAPPLPAPEAHGDVEDDEGNDESRKRMLAVDIESSDGVDGYGGPRVKAPPFSWKKLWEFTGPGFLMSIAFLDPGNLEGDLQAGAIAGYSLLWLLLGSTAMGLTIQLLSLRVGVATSRNLAALCREEYPYWSSILLWLMAEVALIAADIQEVIGSAIAINILSHGVLPLWIGVLITAVDCFIFLLLENYGVRKLEAAFGVLITTMALSFVWMFVEAKPNGKELLMGLLIPKLGTKTIHQAVGLLGGVISPHNVFLYSALVQTRKIDSNKKEEVQEALTYYTMESSVAIFVSFAINLFVTTVFAKGFHNTKQADSVGLINAGQYLEAKHGRELFPIYYIWGIGLLAAGQSSTITGTYAGQFIMGGFLNLQMKQWLRSLITRSFAIVPTMIMAVVYNKSEASLDVLNQWLNVLQGMQIPFALIPLLTMVSSQQLMGDFKIGPKFEKIVWAVASLVILTNGYVLLDLFLSEVDGLVVGIVVCIGIAAYVVAILYLIAYGVGLSSASKGYAYART